jgi:hypothetical protein
MFLIGALALCAGWMGTAAAEVAGATLQAPDVSIVAPPSPSGDQIASDSLFQFVLHHASTHYSSSVGAVGGGLLRWRGGRAETICPSTVGLDQAYEDFVSARVRAVAAYVGAPLDPSGSCKPNVQILFTTEPRRAMQSVLDWGARSLGVKFPHQMEKELEISDGHAVQGWYLTVGGGSSVLNRDASLVGGVQLESLWPRVIPTSSHPIDSARSIMSVILVVDTKRIEGAEIGSIADYLAMAALTVIRSPDHCDPLPSILDAMSASCGARPKPAALTAGDLAFLKALYYHNTGLGLTLSRDEMVLNMTRQFRGS